MVLKNDNSNNATAFIQTGAEKIWFITGASRGFGRVWTEAALKRGDKVAATARNLASITDFKEKYGENILTLELDVTIPDQVNTDTESGNRESLKFVTGMDIYTDFKAQFVDNYK